MLDFQLDKLLRHLLKKISRALRDALIGGNEGFREIEFGLSPRESDVETPPLLFELVLAFGVGRRVVTYLQSWNINDI